MAPQTKRHAGLGRVDEIRKWNPESQPHDPQFSPESDDPAIIIADAFRYACRNGRREATELLLDRLLGLAPDAAAAIDRWNSRAAVARFLIDGQYVGPKFMHDRTPFHVAAARGHLDMVKLFVGEMQKMREAKP